MRDETADETIARLSGHLEPVEIGTRYRTKHKRVAVRLSFRLGVGPVAWLFDRSTNIISRWRRQALQGSLDAGDTVRTTERPIANEPQTTADCHARS